MIVVRVARSPPVSRCAVCSWGSASGPALAEDNPPPADAAGSAPQVVKRSLLFALWLDDTRRELELVEGRLIGMIRLVLFRLR